ncbi:GNAT family N-acetyltransferase [Streptomyces virginiae]|uniref:GNAT family N-acetyltransferase n=1 Tax=Streptomyces virginiae TaxID=1961 RepID=UPI0017812571|nr:GNAT family N-acetyltransferase [Streptomyces virginiae]
MTTPHGPADGIVYRLARPEDAGAIEALDSSFTTPTVFEVTASGDGFGFLLREVPVDPPVHKAFPPEEHDEQGFAGARGPDVDADARTFVALDGGELCGFAAVGYAAAGPPGPRDRQRPDGACRRSVNAPAVHAYRRMGFTFCGLDTALYGGTPSAGERALFMSRPCR